MVATTQHTQPVSAALAATLPPQLDRYQLVRVIGQGGMGIVYEAWDPRVQCSVALKVITATADAHQAEVRLMREARAMASLAHPNVVSVRDVGVCDGYAFVVMELVRGVTLRQWAKPEHSLAEKLRMLIAAGRGLAAVNAAGIVHRDFKPDNVLVDEGGHVRVSDFGIARRVVGDVDFDTRLTSTGMLIGTPAYMAPEQAHALPLTAAADQFSFCVSAWELLAGQLPFMGATPVALIADLVTGNITPAPAEQQWPRGLRRTLRRGLSTSPADRYPTLDELLTELEAVRRSLPLADRTTSGTSSLPRPSRPGRRRRWILGAIFTSAFVSSAAAALISRSQPSPVAPAPTVALVGHETTSTRTDAVVHDAAAPVLAAPAAASPSQPAHRRPVPSTFVAPTRTPDSTPWAPTTPAPEPPAVEAPREVPLAEQLKARLAAVEQLAWDRSFLIDDVPDFRQARSEARTAIEAGDAARLEAVLRPLAARIKGVVVDAAYIERKIARLEVVLDIHNRTPEMTQRILAYFAAARRVANAEHDPARANHILSTAWSMLTPR